MFIRFWNWLTKLPEVKQCETCVVLRQELEYARYQNQQLLNTIIEMNQPKKAIEYHENEPAPVPIPNTRFNSFQEKRKQLEEQSRVEASRLAQLKKDTNASDKVKDIQELEDMIGVGENK